MKQFVTDGIVLRRTSYGEADRIISIITPNDGKISAIAKGARKSGSKIAGGIELLSVNSITLTAGRSELHTIRSSRLSTQFHDILLDIERTNFAYDVLRKISQLAEQISEPVIYETCLESIKSLNNEAIDLKIIIAWFCLRVADLSGRDINLQRDVYGNLLEETVRYKFDIIQEGFMPHQSGEFTSSHLKLLKLIKSYTPDKITTVNGISELLPECVYITRLLAER